MCRAQNTIKCKDFAPEGQTRMGDSYRRRENSYTPTTDQDGDGSGPLARGLGKARAYVRAERWGRACAASLPEGHRTAAPPVGAEVGSRIY